MINQARSLILNNIVANRPALGVFGEEFISAEYRKLDYAGTLDFIRGRLLGSIGDPLYENYRLAQLMGIMHALQYTEELVLSLDTRITYRPFSPVFMPFDFSVEIEEVNDQGMLLTTSGTPVANDAIGKALYRWSVRTAAGPILEVKEIATNVWQPHPITINGTTASPVTLENGVVLQITVPIGGWQVGAEWLVTSTSRPAVDLGLLIDAVNGLSAGVIVDLFQGVPSTFRTLWFQGVSLVDQLGGLLGAFVTKAEEIRQGV